MNACEISIIIPHYNDPVRLERLLQSIGCHPAVQIIVVDDRPDRNLEEYRACQSRFAGRVLFLSNTSPRKGAGAARNEGLKQAEGKWLLFADSDDLLTEDWYDEIVPYLDSSYDIVFFSPADRAENGERAAARALPYRTLIDRYLRGQKDAEEQLRYRFVVPWSKLIRAQLVKEHAVTFDEVMQSNDVMFSVKCGFYADKITASRQTVYCVTERGGSLVKNRSAEVYYRRTKIDCERYQFLKNHLKPDAFRAYGRMSGAEYLYRAAKSGCGAGELLRLSRLLVSYHIPFLVLTHRVKKPKRNA